MFDPNTWERVRKDNFVLQYDVILEGGDPALVDPMRGAARRGGR